MAAVGRTGAAGRDQVPRRPAAGIPGRLLLLAHGHRPPRRRRSRHPPPLAGARHPVALRRDGAVRVDPYTGAAGARGAPPRRTRRLPVRGGGPPPRRGGVRAVDMELAVVVAALPHQLGEPGAADEGGARAGGAPPPPAVHVAGRREDPAGDEPAQGVRVRRRQQPRGHGVEDARVGGRARGAGSDAQHRAARGKRRRRRRRRRRGAAAAAEDGGREERRGGGQARGKT